MLILHGENQVESRRTLAEVREVAQARGDEVVSLDGAKATLTELKQAVEASSLFGGGRLVIVEGARKEAIDYLKESGADKVVVWEGKKLTPAVLKSLGGESREFKIAPEIFNFLESLRPGNTKEMLESWGWALKQNAAEQIFFMLARQLRILMLAKEDPGNLREHPFVVSKAKRQAGYFQTEELTRMHGGLWEIDRGQKTGSSPLSMEQAIELWLLEI